MARKTRTRKRRRKKETQEAPSLEEVDDYLAGLFAVFVTFFTVLGGFLVALAVQDRYFGPSGEYETWGLLVGGIVGGIGGWIGGNRLYRLVPGVGFLMLWIASIALSRSLGPELRQMLDYRSDLARKSKETPRD